MKTGALIRFACEAGAIMAEAPAADRERLAEFGTAIGLAFQLADDLLDSPPMPRRWARRPARTRPPARRRWLRCTARRGPAASWRRLVGQARAVLAPYGREADRLTAAAAFVADRRS